MQEDEEGPRKHSPLTGVFQLSCSHGDTDDQFALAVELVEMDLALGLEGSCCQDRCNHRQGELVVAARLRRINTSYVERERGRHTAFG